MVSLRRLRCSNSACPDRNRLGPAPDNPLQLLCPACGTRTAALDLLRSYSRSSGSMIVSGAIMMSVAWARTAPGARIPLILTGATVFGYALSRIIWQARVLKWLNGLRTAKAS